MKNLLQKTCQKIGNRIIDKMSKSTNPDEVNILFEMGMQLNDWCLSMDIELE